MSRLVIFGDSFAAERPEDITWPKLLAARYDVPIKYYAAVGSNIEYTQIQLMDYLEKDHREDDIIVTVLTSSARSPIVHDDYHPAWSALIKFLAYEPDLIERMNIPHLTKHMAEHMPYYETWLKFFNPKIHRSSCYFIAKTIDTLSNKKLVLSGFDDSDLSFKNRINCFPAGNLMSVSWREHSGGKPKQKFSGGDPRANHLMEENHILLEQYIHECLEGNYLPLNTVAFKEGFIDG